MNCIKLTASAYGPSPPPLVTGLVTGPQYNNLYAKIFIVKKKLAKIILFYEIKLSLVKKL